VDELRACAVPVTDLARPLRAFAPLYRERAHADIGFDELNGQRISSGSTSNDFNRCQGVARACRRPSRRRRGRGQCRSLGNPTPTAAGRPAASGWRPPAVRVRQAAGVIRLLE
jgi:hypothetical protein